MPIHSTCSHQSNISSCNLLLRCSQGSNEFPVNIAIYTKGQIRKHTNSAWMCCAYVLFLLSQDVLNVCFMGVASNEFLWTFFCSITDAWGQQETIHMFMCRIVSPLTSLLHPLCIHMAVGNNELLGYYFHIGEMLMANDTFLNIFMLCA